MSFDRIYSLECKLRILFNWQKPTLLLGFECCCEKALPLGVKVCPDCAAWCAMIGDSLARLPIRLYPREGRQ